MDPRLDAALGDQEGQEERQDRGERLLPENASMGRRRRSQRRVAGDGAALQRRTAADLGLGEDRGDRDDGEADEAEVRRHAWTAR